MANKKGKISIDVFDIIGECSGELKVLWYAGYTYAETKGGPRLRHWYVCKCKCGNLNIVERGPLKAKIVKSCGCKRNEYRIAKFIESITKGIIR